MNTSEVSEKYNIPQDTLRYYERIGLISHVKSRPPMMGFES
jgi:DNA-binding transcriptional MerR regulator